MEKFTVITTTTNNSDYFVSVYSGFSKEQAVNYALNELKYACCKDFTTPASAKGYCEVFYYEVEGRIINREEAREINLYSEEESAYKLEDEKNKYAAVPFNYVEYALNYGSISAEELRKYNSWNEVPIF